MFYIGEIPFVRILVPLMFGILAGYYLPEPQNGSFVQIICCIIALTLILSVILYKKLELFRRRWIPGVLLQVLIGVWAFIEVVNLAVHFSKTTPVIAHVTAVLQITNEPKVKEKLTRFEGLVICNSQRSKCLVRYPKIVVSIFTDESTEGGSLRYGDLIVIPAKFDSISPPLNPGEFNYKEYLADRQIHYQAFFNSNDYKLLDRDRGNPIIAMALRLRKDLVEKFERYLPDREAAGFASTLILGYRADLSPELIEAYSQTGTMHVLSVSGMHVGIVYLVLMRLLKFMDRSARLRLTRAVLTISLVSFYAMLTGFSSPACRAALMLSFIVLGQALNKQQNTYNLIAISAFFLLLYNPLFLFDAGFQLSYLAVTGIVFYQPRIYQLFQPRNSVIDHTWSYCSMSLAAQLATFPLTIYYFHQFPVYFLLSNLFIVLPTALIMYGGILFMFVPIHSLLELMGQLLSLLISYTNLGLYFIQNMPFSSWQGIWITSLECIGIFMILISFVLRVATRSVAYNLVAAILLILLFASWSFKSYENGKRHELLFFSLRKNSCLSYFYRGRSVVVTDISSKDRLFDFSVLPVIHSRGSLSEKTHSFCSHFSGPTYSGLPNFYQFGSIRLMRWDKNFDKLLFTHKIKVDLLLISGNPRVNLHKAASSVDFTSIIIDSNNSDYKITEWTSQAKDLGYSCYVLKKNPAYLLNL